jgi:hypothetical protein
MENLKNGEELSEDNKFIIEKINGDLRLFEFDVELISGSAQARSPQENSALTLSLLDRGVFDGKYGIETTKMVLRNTDFPNRAAIITELELKASDQEKYEKETPFYIQLIKNSDPNLLKGLGEIINSLKLNSIAKEEFLAKGLGLTNAQVDRLDQAPAQEVMSKGDPEKVASISPDTVSNNPQIAAEGQKTAEDIMILKESSKNSNAFQNSVV